MEKGNSEIREINGNKFKVTKERCNCDCHSNEIKMMHIIACCNNGWLERFEEMDGSPRKLKVTWNIDLGQDLDAMTTPGSMVYDEALANKLIEQYGSIELYKQSDDFKKLKDEFENKIKKD